MTVLTVRRPSHTPGTRVLKFQGREFSVGEKLETRDYPHLNHDKWAQLIEQGFLEDEGMRGDADIRRAIRSRRDQGLPSVQPADVMPPFEVVDLTPEEANAIDKPIALQCGECGFHAVSEHGLKVHVGRSHKKE